MGIFDNLKNALGGRSKDFVKESTKGPSQILRDNGMDPSGLKFGIGADGVCRASGCLAQESDRQKIIDLLEATAGINSVKDDMVVEVEAAQAEPTTDEAPPEADSAEAATADTGDEQADTYTVQSGDTLWKIASNSYGDGSKYMKIFEANTDQLENPDRIFPGQKLAIPKLED